MTTNLSPLPIQHFVDNNGNALSGGKLFTYAAGTTTKITTYTDSTGGTPNANPVILNSRGEANVWLTQNTAYKFTLSPSTDTDPPTNPIWTVDNIITPNQMPNPVSTVAPTIGQALVWQNGASQWAPQSLSLFTGGDPTGVNDSYAAFLLADAAGPLTVTPGTYLIGTNWTPVHAITLMPGAILKPKSGITLSFASPVIAGPYQIFNISLGTVDCTKMSGWGWFEWWGAIADAQFFNNGAINATSANLTGVGANFPASGNISVEGAGVSFSDSFSGATLSSSLITTVASGSGASVTLAAAATTSVTGARVWWWTTDNTVAIQAAITYGPYHLWQGNRVNFSYFCSSLTYGGNTAHHFHGIGQIENSGIVFSGAAYAHKAAMTSDAIINTKSYGWQNGPLGEGNINVFEDMSFVTIDIANIIPYGQLWVPTAAGAYPTSTVRMINCLSRGYAGRHMQICDACDFQYNTFQGLAAAHVATLPAGLASYSVIQKYHGDNNQFVQTQRAFGQIWYDNDSSSTGAFQNMVEDVGSFEFGNVWVNTNSQQLTFNGGHAERILATTPINLQSAVGTIVLNTFGLQGLTGTQIANMLGLSGLQMDTGQNRYGNLFLGLSTGGNLGFTFFAGDPNGSLTGFAAGTVCIRTSGASAGARIYVNQDGSTSWIAIASV